MDSHLGCNRKEGQYEKSWAPSRVLLERHRTYAPRRTYGRQTWLLLGTWTGEMLQGCLTTSCSVSSNDTLIVVFRCPIVTHNYLLSKVMSKQSRCGWGFRIRVPQRYLLESGVGGAGAELGPPSCQLQAPDSLNSTKVHCVLIESWRRALDGTQKSRSVWLVVQTQS